MLVAVHKAGRTTRVPFGPWMVVGAAIGIACGESVWAAYLTMAF